MQPISVHNAKPDQPFTIIVSDQTPTVAELHAALAELIQLGYGETAVLRADSEAGLCSVRHLELYDTSTEVQRGELNTDMIFMLC